MDIMDEFGISLDEKNNGETIYYLGKCPLHDDNNPSFAVYPNSNRFVCFSCHPSAGDVIEFVMLYKSIGFIEAKKICTTEISIIDSCSKLLGNFYSTSQVDVMELELRALKLSNSPRRLDIRTLNKVLFHFDELMSEDRWIEADKLLRTHNV
jgi:hypothetical protein